MDHFCPKCKTLLRISASKYVLKDGHLYIVQELACRNPDCDNNGKVVDRVETELEVTKESE